MPRFGRVSLANRAELHPDLAKILDIAILKHDFSIVDGARTYAEQAKNVAKGVSKTMNSRHLPNSEGWAEAADLLPYPFEGWGAVQKGLDAAKRADSTLAVVRFARLMGFVEGVAHAHGVVVRLGIDWDSDSLVGEHSFLDFPHVELVSARPVGSRGAV